MTTNAKSPKVLLLTDTRGGSMPSTGQLVKRYRLARLRVDPRTDGPAGRYEYLKRSFD